MCARVRARARMRPVGSQFQLHGAMKLNECSPTSLKLPVKERIYDPVKKHPADRSSSGTATTPTEFLSQRTTMRASYLGIFKRISFANPRCVMSDMRRAKPKGKIWVRTVEVTRHKKLPSRVCRGCFQAIN